MSKRCYNIILLLFLFSFSSAEIGIGIGWYPYGILSIKGKQKDNFFQGTIGFYGYRRYYNQLMLGIRLGYGFLTEMPNEFKYTHYAGCGGGLLTTDNEIRAIAFEIFYEFEIFPSVKKLPLSLEIGASIVGESTGSFFISISPGIHFFFK